MDNLMQKYILTLIVLLASGMQAFAGGTFSSMVPRNQPIKFASTAEETRSIGCTDGKQLLYVDFNGSDVSKNHFEPILTRYWSSAGSNQKAISSYLIGKTKLDKGQVQSVSLTYSSSGTISTSSGSVPSKMDELTMLFSFNENKANLLIENHPHPYGQTAWVPAGNYQCEIYSEPYFINQSGLIYDCTVNASFHLNRGYDVDIVHIRYRDGTTELIGRLQGASSDDRHWMYTEEYSSTGESFRRNYRTPVGMTTWRDVFSEHPPEEFFIESVGTCKKRK